MSQYMLLTILGSVAIERDPKERQTVLNFHWKIIYPAISVVIIKMKSNLVGHYGNLKFAKRVHNLTGTEIFFAKHEIR